MRIAALAWCALLCVSLRPRCLDADLVAHNCDSHPSVWLNKYAREFDRIPGFEFKHVNVIYDVRYNKTLFSTVLLDKRLMRNTKPVCKLCRGDVGAYPPYVAAYIVPHRFGGSCEPMNLFPQNLFCHIGDWNIFKLWLKKDVRTYGRVKYCMELSYATASDKKPYKFVARAYSYPENEYLRSISMNNPFAESCEMLPHAI